MRQQALGGKRSKGKERLEGGMCRTEGIKEKGKVSIFPSLFHPLVDLPSPLCSLFFSHPIPYIGSVDLAFRSISEKKNRLGGGFPSI